MKRVAGLLSVCLLSMGLFVAAAQPAFAKATMEMRAREHSVPVNGVIHFTGSYYDDAGNEGHRICLYEVTRSTAYRKLAPCVSLHQRNGRPISDPSQYGYFTAEVTARTPGTLTVIPLVELNGRVDSSVGDGLPDYAVTVTVTAAKPAGGTSPRKTPATPTPTRATPTPAPSPTTVEIAASPTSPDAARLTAATGTPRGRFPLGAAAAAVGVACLLAGGLFVASRRRRDKHRGAGASE